jgi:hypothetical protein
MTPVHCPARCCTAPRVRIFLRVSAASLGSFGCPAAVVVALVLLVLVLLLRPLAVESRARAGDPKQCDLHARKRVTGEARPSRRQANFGQDFRRLTFDRVTGRKNNRRDHGAGAPVPVLPSLLGGAPADVAARNADATAACRTAKNHAAHREQPW